MIRCPTVPSAVGGTLWIQRWLWSWNWARFWCRWHWNNVWFWSWRSGWSSSTSASISNFVAVVHPPSLLPAVSQRPAVTEFSTRCQTITRTVLGFAHPLSVHPPTPTFVWIFRLFTRLFGVVAKTLALSILACGLCTTAIVIVIVTWDDSPLAPLACTTCNHGSSRGRGCRRRYRRRPATWDDDNIISCIAISCSVIKNVVMSTICVVDVG